MNILNILLFFVYIQFVCSHVKLNTHQPQHKSIDDDSGEYYSYNKKPILFCEPEIFRHAYITIADKTEVMTNKWQRAKIGERAGLEEVCLLPNGLPLTRNCSYNWQTHSAEWESIETIKFKKVKCLRQPRENIISTQLNTVHSEILSNRRLGKGLQGRREVTEQVCSLLKEPNFKLLPADVHFTSQILKTLSDEAQDIELSKDVISICNAMMSGDRVVLRKSADLNATNSLLETFENYMDALTQKAVPNDHCGKNYGSKLTLKKPSTASSSTDSSSYASTVEIIDESFKGVAIHISSNISVFFINPKCANITGIALYDPLPQFGSDRRLLKQKHNNFLYRYIYMNETTDNLRRENVNGLQLATFVPQHLWEYVERNFGNEKNPIIVLKIYSHDSLFVESSYISSLHEPFSAILSISIPEFKNSFPESLPFLLRNQYHTKPKISARARGAGCSYWNYNSWVMYDVETNATDLLNEPIILCGTKHLTQFSYLLGGSSRSNDLDDDILITPINSRALDIISVVGCTLSLLGLIGIWLTAALFRSWWSQASTKILLHLCVALTLQMILFLFVNTDDMSEHLVTDRYYINCVILGAFLQYSILVLFAWMLIIALLQFQRYVTVIGIDRPRHYILKSAVAAWGFPLIPTLLVACIDPHSYIPTTYELRNDSGICYPSGHGLNFGVVLPVVLIVITNTVIFIYVFYSVSHSLNQATQRNEKQMIIKQLKLSVLLFFLLGLSWVFGIFAFMGGGLLFSYLFCLTATMQGFVLFVYFVILDAKVRNDWLYLLCPSLRKKSEKRTTELQSMTTTSTGIVSGEQH